MVKRIKFLLSIILCTSFCYGFKPFTRVTSVCPKCPPPPSDVLSLTSGGQIAAKIVGQNEDHYVIERFGEYRLIKKSATASVKWLDPAGPSTIASGDQVIMKNEVVLHGVILNEQAKRYLVIQSGTNKYVVWHSQIKTIYKNGLPYR